MTLDACMPLSRRTASEGDIHDSLLKRAQARIRTRTLEFINRGQLADDVKQCREDIRSQIELALYDGVDVSPDHP